jgi:hypothetical protein
MPGTWTIRVTASLLNLPPQDYTVVSEMLPVEGGPCPSVPAADVQMRDNHLDFGQTPSRPFAWLSPDIWNRRHDDGQTGHENPAYWLPNYIYARVKNASAQTVKATSIDVWCAPAATALLWPRDLFYVGRIFVPNLGANETRKVGPLAWRPSPPRQSDHYCFYARAASPQDAIPTGYETDAVESNTAFSNNIVWRNVHIVDFPRDRSVFFPGQDGGLTFLVRNVTGAQAEVDFILRAPKALAHLGELRVRLGSGAELNPQDLLHLEEENPEMERVMIRGHRMGPWQEEKVTLILEHPRVVTLSHSYVVDIAELIEGHIVGGIRHILRGRSP